MSGHNKWSTIKHKKAAVDAKKGQIFSRYSKEITLAAKAGGKDMDMNPRLRTAVLAAKGVNMPNDNIDRAIKKGVGELGGAAMEDLMFEGYAPGGVGILATCLTDNRNRTAANVRTIFGKHGGSMASTGAVSFQFSRKSRFVVEGAELTEDKLLELLLEAGADVEDVSCEGGVGEIIAAPDAFALVAKTLENAKIKISESSLTMIPANMMEVSDVSAARQANRLIEALEEDDDVQAVYHNLGMTDAVMEQLANE
jgi:YebC/PmpR family DNA-binding regulatory protein